VRRSLVLVTVLLGLATSAFAQSVPNLEVSGGWQIVRGEFDTIPAGWSAEVAGNLNRVLGLVVEVDGLYETFEDSFDAGGAIATLSVEDRLHAFLGGARLNLRAVPRITPFAELLAGVVHRSVSDSLIIPGFISEETSVASQTEPALQLGGGATLDVTSALGVRVGVGHRRIFLDGEIAGLTRVTVGLAVRF
jgi:hypothetical protein